MKYHATKHSRCRYLFNSIKKHGWNNFKQEIIIDDVPEEELNNLEISYIELENTIAPYGYNLTKGGEGMTGFHHSQETKQNLSVMNTGKKHPQYGKKRAQETRKKISKARRSKRKGSTTQDAKSGLWKAYGPRYMGYKYLGSHPTKEMARYIVDMYVQLMEAKHSFN